MTTTTTQQPEEPHFLAPCVEAGIGQAQHQAVRSVDVTRKEGMMNNQWETFCDVGYYHMWRLRRENERGWNDGFHINTRDEAQALCKLLNKLEREIENLKASGIHTCHDQCQRPMCIMRRERDKLGKECDEYKYAVDFWKHVSDSLEQEIVAVKEQRDKAHTKIENQAERIKYLEGATNHATGTPLSKMTEQRDRLAEALLWAKKEHDARIAIFAYAGPVISAEYERLGMRLMEAKHNATIARESALAIVKETKKQQKKTTH